MDKQYLPSHKRVENPPRMRLTGRDVCIILFVHALRFLTEPQVEALLFPSSTPRGCKTSCQRRLQLLFHHGFLERLFMPIVLGNGRAPIVYALAEKGARLVAREMGVDLAELNWRSRQNVFGYDFISHRLAINDFHIAVKLLCNTTDFELTKWIDEQEFRTATMKNKVPVRMRGARVVRNYPDGYFTLSTPKSQIEAHFFLEIDQETMSNTRWQDKMKAYIEFRQRRLAETHYGTQNFRLLTVTTNAARLKNLKKATEKVVGDHYFWFTTKEKIDIWKPNNLLKPIWAIATRDGCHPLF